MAFGDVNDSTIREVERIQAELIFNYEQFPVFCSWPRLGKLLLRDRWKRCSNILKSPAEIILPLIRTRKKLKQEERKQSELVSYTDTLLDMQMNDDHDQEAGKLEEAGILSLCSEFINASTDTSLTTLQWIMANIVKHQHIQAKLFAEIKAVVGEGAEEIKEEDVEKMTYLKAVILETLRIHPPSTFLVPHAVLEDEELLGYRISKDTIVNFVISLMGQDQLELENPMEFRPEWLLNRGENGEPDRASDVTAYKMMLFGSGRRICLGKRLALLNLEYFVSNLV
ncbi:cytochrome P450 89A2-like [Juglans microcarpa x Juglans regia]|uniref:cytochrome P450 89A2-like n=1 Tax=Juglans microcarpa x Juglans regia TaxID=2249226 RepID=UPI001B7D925D|nr:cytochrome P450 89A2-like [Juglans microcarpa x Juglans regia]